MNGDDTCKDWYMRSLAKFRLALQLDDGTNDNCYISAYSVPYFVYNLNDYLGYSSFLDEFFYSLFNNGSWDAPKNKIFAGTSDNCDDTFQCQHVKGIVLFGYGSCDLTAGAYNNWQTTLDSLSIDKFFRRDTNLLSRPSSISTSFYRKCLSSIRNYYTSTDISIRKRIEYDLQSCEPVSKGTKATQTTKGDNQMNLVNTTFNGIKGLEHAGEQVSIFGYSMITKEIVFQLNDYNYYSFDKESGTLTNVSTLVMPLPVPGVIMPAKFSEVQVGDLLMTSDKHVKVVSKVNKATMNLLDYGGEVKAVTPVKNALLGETSYVSKINNLAASFGSDFTDNPLMLSMMFSDGKNNNNLATMLAMQQMFKKN